MKRKKKQVNQQEEILIQEIHRTKMALETAYSKFQYSLDPDLIDSYIYEVNAAQKRYKFLLKQVKNLHEETIPL